MHDDDEFLRSIPPFLRRYHEPAPRKLPIRPRDLPTPAASSVEMPKSAPISATATEAPKPAPIPATVTVAPKKPAVPAAPAAQRARIALAFENQDIPETPDLAEGPGLAEGPDLAEGKDDEDINFQISLPRGVARQICMLAVKRDSTQRAVVLRALRLAGLSVPDGIDIDRRATRQA